MRRAMRGEDGMVTAFVTIATLSMLMAAGLVLDGGALLAAHRSAIDQATAAARAGAQAVEADALRRRERTVDPAAAASAAEVHLRRNHATSDFAVSVAGDRVRVTVTVTRPLGLLRLVGLTHATASGSGESRIVRGVTEGET